MYSLNYAANNNNVLQCIRATVPKSFSTREPPFTSLYDYNSSAPPPLVADCLTLEVPNLIYPFSFGNHPKIRSCPTGGPWIHSLLPLGIVPQSHECCRFSWFSVSPFRPLKIS